MTQEANEPQVPIHIVRDTADFVNPSPDKKMVSVSSPSGKRTRDPEDEVYLDNLRSQKRYLSEVCFLDGYIKSANSMVLHSAIDLFTCHEISPSSLLVDHGVQFKRINSRRLTSSQHDRVSSSV